MSAKARQLVAKLWNYCDVLRDDGVSTIDYVEQLTFLLFLKMAHERANRGLNPDLVLRPAAARWQKLLDYEGDDLESERFHPFSYDELAARDKANLDITWLRDPSLDEADSLLPPEVIAREIVEDLQAALAEFAAIADSLASTRPAGDPVTDDTASRSA